jgi:hypothetical protein
MADAIETVAALMNRLTKHDVAAKLTGGAERIRHESGCAMAPNEAGRYERETASFREALGVPEAKQLQETGRAMRTSEAVELAMTALAEAGQN